MRRIGSGVAAIALGLAGGVLAVAACNASSETSGVGVTGPDAGRPGDSGLGDGGVAADAGTGIEANAVVLVHAASFPAFRLCFENAGSEQPQPSLDLMPESNVVGVEVGTALRLPPRSEILGKAFVFAEATLRPLYTATGAGPTCTQLLGAAGTKSAAIAVGEVTASLARGVNALVLAGCRKQAEDPTASAARCGDDWTAAEGNLALHTVPLPAYGRLDPSKLPVQLLQLSPSLDRSAAGRAVGIAVGPLDAGAASSPVPLVEGAAPFGVPVPSPPVQLPYAPADLAAFASTGVFVTLGGPVDEAGAPVTTTTDAGAREIVLAQSLADIQRRSSPRSVPPEWFATASSFVVLSVGDLDPRAADGGPDGDPRRALHLLAIPLSTPDAGAAQTAP